MKRIFAFAVLFASMAMFTSCGDGITLSSDYDKTKDFTDFKTFGLLPWPEENRSIVNEFDQKRILDAVKAEFVARGMTYMENVKSADIAINVFVTAKQETEHQAYTNYYGGGYGYYYSPYAGMGSSSTTVREVNYIVGTIIIDVFDVSDRNLAWQGIGSGVVDENPKNKDQKVADAIRKIVSQYPVPKMGR